MKIPIKTDKQMKIDFRLNDQDEHLDREKVGRGHGLGAPSSRWWPRRQWSWRCQQRVKRLRECALYYTIIYYKIL